MKTHVVPLLQGLRGLGPLLLLGYLVSACDVQTPKVLTGPSDGGSGGEGGSIASAGAAGISGGNSAGAAGAPLITFSLSGNVVIKNQFPEDVAYNQLTRGPCPDSLHVTADGLVDRIEVQDLDGTANWQCNTPAF